MKNKLIFIFISILSLFMIVGCISNLAKEITKAQEEIANYVKLSDYSSANQVLINNYIKEANQAFNSAKNKRAINDIIASTKAKIDEVLTYLQESKGYQNYLVLKGEILIHSLNEKTILIDQEGKYSYDDDTKIVQLVDDEIVEKSANDLYLGMKNVYYYLNKEANKIDYILINGEIAHDIIKVFINVSTAISGDNDKYHQSISFRSASAMNVRRASDNNALSINPNTTLTISHANNEVIVKEGSNILIQTNELVIVEPTSAKISITSISRAQGVPSYYGSFEVQAINNALQLVNNVPLEDYLKTVVPSEMPSSWHQEALRAQAISARTYALADVFSQNYFSLGYHVDDSVMSQVYNNIAEASSTNQAILATKGIGLKTGDNFVSAVFFSTSSSATGLPGDAWFTGSNPTPDSSGSYHSSFYAKEDGVDLAFDINDEASMLAFYQKIKFDSYDGDSSFHRWYYEGTLSQLKSQLNANLKTRYNARPDQVLTLVSGSFISQEIPTDIGELLDLKVHSRGEGGLITSLEITTSTATFRVYGEYNIRMLFLNIFIRTSTSSTTFYSGSRTFSFLPSAYFALVKTNDAIQFYGGGWGHGTGMSQYGANNMAKRGMSYQDILEFYYNHFDYVRWINEEEQAIDLFEAFKQIA